MSSSIDVRGSTGDEPPDGHAEMMAGQAGRFFLYLVGAAIVALFPLELVYQLSAYFFF